MRPVIGFGAASVAGLILFACSGVDFPLYQFPTGNDAAENSSAGDEPQSDAAGAFDAGSEAAADDASDASDASDDADAGAVVVQACSALTPFTNVSKLAGINTDDLDEIAPRLTADEKTIVFARYDVPNTDAINLYTATRASRDDDFGAATLVVGLGGAGTNGDPQFFGDGSNNILFASSRQSDPPDFTSNPPIFFRAQKNNDTFENVTQVFPGSTADGWRPFLTSDGSELFFGGDNGAGGAQIYRSLADGKGGFSAPAPALVAGIAAVAPYSDNAPVLSQEAQTMYFASERSPAPGASVLNMHIYVTTRLNTNDPFDGNPVRARVDVINGVVENLDFDEWPGWLSTDGCRLYFDTNRGDGNNFEYDIWVATKTE